VEHLSLDEIATEGGGTCTMGVAVKHARMWLQHCWYLVSSFEESIAEQFQPMVKSQPKVKRGVWPTSLLNEVRTLLDKDVIMRSPDRS
jgi:hypothetical protein